MSAVTPAAWWKYPGLPDSQVRPADQAENGCWVRLVVFFARAPVLLSAVQMACNAKVCAGQLSGLPAFCWSSFIREHLDLRRKRVRESLLELEDSRMGKFSLIGCISPYKLFSLFDFNFLDDLESQT